METWKGRIDGTEKAHLRWHQWVKEGKNIDNYTQKFVFLGFESDEGVRRNKGRIGARKAPNVIRKVASNFPVHSLPVFYDNGNITVENEELEKGQQELTHALSDIYRKNGKSIVLGGGHEVTYPHSEALNKVFDKETIGILNFDAHFDNRVLQAEIGPSSGTGFYQIAEEGEIHSLHIGIQTNSNTAALFDYAHSQGMQYIVAQDLFLQKAQNQEVIRQFISQIDLLYVTVCMDVFSSAFAPGVSATAYNGIIPDPYFMSVFQEIVASPKLKAFDIAEVNPDLDIDFRTAKLASQLIFEVMTQHA